MNKNKFLLYFVIYHALRISFLHLTKKLRLDFNMTSGTRPHCYVAWRAIRIYFQVYLHTSLSYLSGCPLKHKAPPPRLAWRDICFIHLLFSAGCPESLAPQKTRNGLWRPSASPTRLTPVPANLRGEPNLFTPVYSLHNHAWVTNYLNWFSLRPTLRGFFCPHTTIYEMENRQRIHEM